MPRPPGMGTLQILAAIRDGATYGLDIVAHTGLPSGTVYPTLGRVGDRGWVDSEWEDEAEATAQGRPRRRHYRLTPEGARTLREAARRMRLRAASLDPAWAGEGRT